jgi:hypothetical protein
MRCSTPITLPVGILSTTGIPGSHQPWPRVGRLMGREIVAGIFVLNAAVSGCLRDAQLTLYETLPLASATAAFGVKYF